VNEHDREQAAAAALGALSPEEAGRLQESVAVTPELAAQLDDDRATVSMLEAGVAREAPPADLFDRVLVRIEMETEAVPAPSLVQPQEPGPRRRPFRERAGRLWPAFAAGAATAVAALALVLVLTGDDPGSPDARAAVTGTDEFPGVRGEARLYGAESDDGRLVVDLDDIPAPGPGEHYEVWVLRESAGGAMEAVGVFSPAESSVDLEFSLPGPGDYEAVDVSVEPDGGPASHSGRSLAGGRFEPAVS
jgi:anti-sigma-K factor RskA